MTLDPEARAYLEATVALGLPSIAEQGAVEARRVAVLRTPQLAGEPEPVARVEDRTLPGPGGPIGIRLYAPEASYPLPILAFFHGGGWVTGDLDTHDSACRGLANRASCLVVAVDFRCAPEHRFPAALEDCWAAVEWLGREGAELGGDPARLALCGDSAGGNLAAAVALRARDRGGPPIAAQLLVYPVLDCNLETPSYVAKATGYGLTRDSMRWYWEQYLGEDGNGLASEASPLRTGDLAGLPPALVVTCEHDPLHDEGVAYARRLAAAGVRVEQIDEEGMIHGYFRMPAVIGRARKSWDDCARFLRPAFG
ncbi:MAG TPA: alpha/beta hydrolase [Candidatus Dormibacteraeota bacterium]|jgi:acetyl esterase